MEARTVEVTIKTEKFLIRIEFWKQYVFNNLKMKKVLAWSILILLLAPERNTPIPIIIVLHSSNLFFLEEFYIVVGIYFLDPLIYAFYVTQTFPQ